MLDENYFATFEKLSAHYRSTNQKQEFLRLYVESGLRIFSLLKLDRHPNYLYWNTEARLLLSKPLADITQADLQTATEFYSIMLQKYTQLRTEGERPQSGRRQQAIYGVFLAGLLVLALFTFTFLATYHFSSPISFTLILALIFIGYFLTSEFDR